MDITNKDCVERMFALEEPTFCCLVCKTQTKQQDSTAGRRSDEWCGMKWPAVSFFFFFFLFLLITSDWSDLSRAALVERDPNSTISSNARITIVHPFLYNIWSYICVLLLPLSSAKTRQRHEGGVGAIRRGNALKKTFGKKNQLQFQSVTHLSCNKGPSGL